MPKSEDKPKKKRKKKAATEENGGQKEHKPNWREVYASAEDIKAFLSDHVYLRHNVITGRVECRIPEADYFAEGWAGVQCTDRWQPISDRVVNSLWVALSREKPVRAQDIYRVIESDYVPDFHPFRYYLEHLPPWDGESDHILAMSASVTVKGDVEERRTRARSLVYDVAAEDILPPQAVKYICEDYCIDLPEELQNKKVRDMSPIFQKLIRELQMSTFFEGEWTRITEIPHDF